MGELEIQNLSYSYVGRQVLYDISFTIQPGLLYGILGQNGSGKTTLLKCISGIKRVQVGKVLVNGKDICKMNRKYIAKEISYVPQQSSIVFPFSVVDMVLMGRISSVKYWSVPKAEDEKEAIKLLSSLSLEYLSDRPFDQLSGGEKQMVFIARAIFQNSLFMLLDEPTSHLDYKNQVVILNIIKKVLREKKLAVVMSVHDPNLAMHYCDRIIMIKNGRILRNGETMEVLDRMSLSDLYDIDISVEKTNKGLKVIAPDWLSQGSIKK